MTKLEPLKDKVIDEDKDLCLSEDYFKKEDIKSAVEWLKEQMLDSKITLDREGEQAIVIYYGIMEDLIDKAFEDVTKKDEGGENS